MNYTKRPVLKWGRLREELTTNFHFLFSYANSSLQFSPRITSAQFASQATWNNREMTAETRSIIFRRPLRYRQRFSPLTTIKQIDLMGKEKWVFLSLHSRPKTPQKKSKICPSRIQSKPRSIIQWWTEYKTWSEKQRLHVFERLRPTNMNPIWRR